MTALRCRKKRPLWSASFITGTPIEYKKHKHSTGLFTFLLLTLYICNVFAS